MSFGRIAENCCGQLGTYLGEHALGEDDQPRVVSYDLLHPSICVDASRCRSRVLVVTVVTRLESNASGAGYDAASGAWPLRSIERTSSPVGNGRLEKRCHPSALMG